MLDGLKAFHSDRIIAKPADNTGRSTKIEVDPGWKETGTYHPIVRTHPETGKKALYVDALQTVCIQGMTEVESQPILNFLFQHCNRLEFTCRFRWRTGSIAFWDNRCTHHYAINDTTGYRRIMRRIHLRGDRPR